LRKSSNACCFGVNSGCCDMMGFVPYVVYCGRLGYVSAGGLQTVSAGGNVLLVALDGLNDTAEKGNLELYPLLPTPLTTRG